MCGYSSIASTKIDFILMTHRVSFSKNTQTLRVCILNPCSSKSFYQ